MNTVILAKAWPDFRGSHGVTPRELRRLAWSSDDVVEAQKVWENENWWRDESPRCGLAFGDEVEAAAAAEKRRDFDVGGDKTPFSD